MVVRFKKGADADVLSAGCPLITKYFSRWMVGDLLPLVMYPNWTRSSWCVGWGSSSLSNTIDAANPDIINLHWICRGFVPVKTLAEIERPMVWTLHDMWAFTGGCHYSDKCAKYRHSCGECAQLGSRRERDLTRKVWERKNRLWGKLDLTVVTPSRWLANCARESSLLRDRRVVVIPNGIDISVFKPPAGDAKLDPKILAPNKKAILFGGIKVDQAARKGMRYLVEALRRLASSGWKDKAQLLVFGMDCEHGRIDVGLKSSCVGTIDDDDYLARLYGSADVFVAPSLQENLANTVMEALSCGVPCVAFDVGGMSDMIEHKRNGYLAKPLDTEDLARGIAWVIGDEERRRELSRAAREKVVREFALNDIANRYRDLYEDILKG